MGAIRQLCLTDKETYNMVRFILGVIVGAGVFAMVGATYPKATKQAYKTGIDTATSTVAQGATAAEKVVNEQLAKNGK